MSGYGTGKYGTGPYKCEGSPPDEILHYYALKKIFPIKNIAGQFDADLDIEGYWLDQIYFQAGYHKGGLHDQFFPDTVTSNCIQDYIRVYGLDPLTATKNDIIAAIRIMVSKNGRMTLDYYADLVDTYLSLTPGTTTIHEGHDDMFVVSTDPAQATALSAQLWENTWNWTWTITVPAPTPSQKNELKELIDRLKPAFTQVEWSYT